MTTATADVREQATALKGREGESGELVKANGSEWGSLITFEGGRMKIPSFREAWGMAGIIAREHMGLDSDTQGSIAVKLCWGEILRIPPWAAIKGIAVIKGMPSLWGDVFLGVCMASPVFDHTAFKEWHTGDIDSDGVPSANYVAYCRVARVGTDPIERTFSVADAKLAGLWNRQASSGAKMPWSAYARRMLQMRARGWACRDKFADVLHGFYVDDELSDAKFIDVEATSSETKAAAEAGPGGKAREAIKKQLANSENGDNGEPAKTEPGVAPPITDTPRRRRSKRQVEPEPRQEEPPRSAEPEPKRDPTAEDVASAEVKGARSRIHYALRVMDDLQVNAALNRAKVGELRDIDKVCDLAELEEIEAAILR